MSRTSVHFFSEDISFIPKHKSRLREWLFQAILNEGFKPGELNFIFCSDEYLLAINREYLNHNTLTDIITFDNSGPDGCITGDIFISIDRVQENAAAYGVKIQDELHRVMIHGSLHLLGYADKTRSEKKLMTQKEDQYLAVRNFT